MRTEFRFHLVIPQGASHVVQPLPVFPSRLKSDEAIKITAPESSTASKDYTKVWLILLSLGLVGAIVVLSVLLYQRGFLSTTEKRSETTGLAVSKQKLVPQVVTHANPSTPSLPSSSIPPNQQDVATYLDPSQQSTGSASEVKVTDSNPTLRDGSVASNVARPLPPSKEPLPQPEIKGVQSAPLQKNSAGKVVQQPSVSPQVKVAPVPNLVSSTPSSRNQTHGAVEVPKFIIANENTASRPTQSGIFKRSAPVQDHRTDTKSAVVKADSTQKLF